MVWMETYLHYCSVRLGVIIVAVLTFLQIFIPAILLLVFGLELLEPILQLFKNDDHYRKNVIVIRLADWIESRTINFVILCTFLNFLHIINCLLAIFGALKLQKWFLVPFIVGEFIRVICCLSWHILLMIMLKKKLNLGVLIAVTLAGGFLILYLGFNWAASVALFQIIELVHTERYRQLYGNDPFKPLIPPSTGQHAYGTIESVRVLVTPNTNEIDEQKKQQQFTNSDAPQPVIAVLPANFQTGDRVPIVSRRPKRWPLQQQPQQQRPQQIALHQRNEYNADYGNWQWAELAAGGAKQRSTLIGQHW